MCFSPAAISLRPTSTLAFLPSFLPTFSTGLTLPSDRISVSLSLPPSYLRNPENEIFRAVFLPFAVPQILRAYASAYGHEVSSLGYSRPEEGKGKSRRTDGRRFWTDGIPDE